MPDRVVIEEFLVTLTVPRRLPAAKARAVRRSLTGRRFRARLAQAVRAVVAHYPSLRRVAMTISQ